MFISHSAVNHLVSRSIPPSLLLSRALLTDSHPTWVIDSGCTQFMCNKLFLFSNLKQVDINVRLGDESTVKVDQAGSISLFNCSFEAFYTPSFCISLISVPDLD